MVGQGELTIKIFYSLYYKKGKLILLDESFSNIDLKSAKDILNNLLSHVETVIVVSHRNEEIDPQIFKAVDIK